MLKQEIRYEYSQKRMNLEAKEADVLSRAVSRRFEQLLLPSASWLLSYFPLKGKNEFDVKPCEEWLKKKIPGLRLAWPCIDPVNQQMEAYEANEKGIFEKNRYQIPEPVGGTRVLPADIDIVFVPLLVFDERGYRVGYGKGYYDRYLPRCRPNLLKIGFCFFEALPTISDIDEFDVPLNLCITPSRLYEF